MADNSDNDGSRILILGSEGHPSGVTAYSWDLYPSNLNVADFDVVILNLAPLGGEDPPTILHGAPPEPIDFYRLLFSKGSELVLVGPPDTSVRVNASMWVKIQDLLPFAFGYVKRFGEEIHEVSDDFEFYFRKVSRYSFYFTGQWSLNTNAGSILTRIFGNVSDQSVVNVNYLAETRFHKPIGLKVEFSVKGARTKGVPSQSGPAIWLPVPSRISAEEAVNLLLRERYEVGMEAKPPDWLGDFVLPRETPIRGKLERLRRDISELEEELEAETRNLEKETDIKRILYERDHALEPVVRQALEELGAVTEPPESPGREDGRFRDPTGRAGILEIKARASAIGVSDVRQLDQWVRDAIAEEDWDGKGVLIGTGWVDVRPEERTDQFSSNAVTTAERFQLALMSTDQVFYALQEDQNGELDRDEFWEAVMTTNGKVNLPGLGNEPDTTV